MVDRVESFDYATKEKSLVPLQEFVRNSVWFCTKPTKREESVCKVETKRRFYSLGKQWEVGDVYHKWVGEGGLRSKGDECGE